MDTILDQRWEESRPPFDGDALVFEDGVHKIVGTAIVRFLLDALDARFGMDAELLVNEDWHVHDGFIKESRRVRKADLLSQLKTDPDRWIRVVDYQVYWGIYDSSYRFYLRFGLEEDELDILALDLTTDETTARELAEKIRS